MRSVWLLLGCLTAFGLSLFSCYSTLFWGWVTATPLTAEGLRRAQFNTYAWFGLSLLALLVAFVLTILYAWPRGRPNV